MLLFFSIAVNAQEEILIKDIIDGIIDDLPEDFDLSELSERLIFLRKHPINLNQVQPDELKSLFFLSPMQISNFFLYRSDNGNFIDVLELQAIPSFDIITIQKLLPFVHLVGDPLKKPINRKNLVEFGENDIVIRYASLLEKQKGYRNLTGSNYVGTPEKLLVRYKYNFLNRLAISVVMEKDAGEKIIGKPMDFLAANITINDIRPIKKIVIGDYGLQFGQGLTLWSGFGFGKGPDVTSVAKKDIGLRSYNSANEYSFFRGIGSKISLSKKITLTSFLSSRKHDATLTIANDGTEVLTTLNETGYHRTLNELKNANTVVQKCYGAILEYYQSNLNIGLIGYQSHYSKTFITNNQTYQFFSFTGNRLLNMGFHYNYSFKNIYLFGEFSKSLKTGNALLNGLLISLSNQVSAIILHRHYQKNYHNFFNQAPAESEGFNETGFYAGLNISPSKRWLISLYTDYFKFPWLKFRIDAPSKGYEVLAQLSYTPSKTFKAILRYKSELKQQNTDFEAPINYLDDVIKQSYRADMNWKLSRILSLQNRVEVSKYKKGDVISEFGYLVYQDCAINPLRSKLSGNLRVAYFSTPTYNSRLYAYEDDVLYNFSFGIYNGKGFRNYVNIKYRLLKNTDLWLRYARFYYKNTSTIGSGLDEINGNRKSEIKVQMRVQF